MSNKYIVKYPNMCVGYRRATLVKILFNFVCTGWQKANWLCMQYLQLCMEIKNNLKKYSHVPMPYIYYKLQDYLL